jgi:hypothetical protein
VRDYRTLETTVRDAKEWVSDERLWNNPEYSRILSHLEQIDERLMQI